MTAAATYDLGKLHGGLRLPGEKEQSTSRGVQQVPLPRQLFLPLQQHVGEPAQPIVAAGDRVLKGQLIAAADGELSAPIHASTSGTVLAIEPWPVSRRHGEAGPCIVIESDGLDQAYHYDGHPVQYQELAPDELLQKILQGGIVGLGGAVFPTAQKLMQAVTAPLTHLILNGVECEPFISCDDMLMREQARNLLGGAQILMHALRLEKCFVVVESDKPEAIHGIAVAMSELDDKRIVLKQVPTIYPSGGEDQLVQLVTNLEVPSGGLPTDVGCVVQNVGTAAAIHRWIVDGEPLISRITTITGDGIASPVNVEARIGTPVSELIAVAGGYTERANQMIIGGPMTGKSVTTDRVPLVKATNCVLVLSDVIPLADERPCIRCGECAIVCPIELQPQQLFWFACSDNEKQLRAHGLTDCIECGCCDLVCPSHIPLTADFRKAKARMREMEDEKARAERARLRFEARTTRLMQEQAQRDQELAKQKQDALSAGPDAIREILERSRSKNQKDDQ
ncbi:MAG: electron transport complex subunit RsxC [Gammaproteobacteria bacterium]|nr:electron transport complex subunit RsxC [Gammaproteobacteria bacterium]MDH5214581.1 electron transport complex subunit RsxC [Gammaproteobacteria bacterium]